MLRKPVGLILPTALLVDGMLTEGSRRKIESRPIVQTLRRVAAFTMRNFFQPCSMYESGIRN